MRAVVQTGYGKPSDVLEVRALDRPLVEYLPHVLERLASTEVASGGLFLPGGVLGVGSDLASGIGDDRVGSESRSSRPRLTRHEVRGVAGALGSGASCSGSGDASSPRDASPTGARAAMSVRPPGLA